jgi:23S rRNA pseudouridine1911/1915/1917 synthase
VSPGTHTVTVLADAPRRLDAFLRRALPLSQRLARQAIADGSVRVNGRRAAKGTLLAPGDVVTLPRLAPLAPEPDLAVRIVYEDASLLALDKPAGMPAHALDPRQRGTAAAFVLARHPETADVGEPLAPGLVHRLDTGTSGLLLAARTPAAYRSLRAALRARAVEKEYLAVVEGTPPESATVTLALAHDPQDRRRMIPAPPGARAWEAETTITLAAAGPARFLVRAIIRTGVTHQVRVHLAHLGHPVVGDTLYGGSPLPAPRHALHASTLRFAHPEDQRLLEIHSDLPTDLRALL